jgi:hypothetical protein
LITSGISGYLSAVANPFEREDNEPIGLPEPYAALMAALSDWHEQVELFRKANAGNAFVAEITLALEAKIVGLGQIVEIMGQAVIGQEK